MWCGVTKDSSCVVWCDKGQQLCGVVGLCAQCCVHCYLCCRPPKVSSEMTSSVTACCSSLCCMTETQEKHFVQTSFGLSSEYKQFGCGDTLQSLSECGCACLYACLSALLCSPVACREIRFSSFLTEFKNGKERAMELLSKLPHCIPHRQVGYYPFTCMAIKEYRG